MWTTDHLYGRLHSLQVGPLSLCPSSVRLNKAEEKDGRTKSGDREARFSPPGFRAAISSQRSCASRTTDKAKVGILVV